LVALGFGFYGRCWCAVCSRHWQGAKAGSRYHQKHKNHKQLFLHNWSLRRVNDSHPVSYWVERTSTLSGSATPMRGKSRTCRGPHFFIAVLDRCLFTKLDGKSETCRASEWLSQYRTIVKRVSEARP